MHHWVKSVTAYWSIAMRVSAGLATSRGGLKTLSATICRSPSFWWQSRGQCSACSSQPWRRCRPRIVCGSCLPMAPSPMQESRSPRRTPRSSRTSDVPALLGIRNIALPPSHSTPFRSPFLVGAVLGHAKFFVWLALSQLVYSAAPCDIIFGSTKRKRPGIRFRVQTTALQLRAAGRVLDAVQGACNAAQVLPQIAEQGREITLHFPQFALRAFWLVGH